MGFYEAMASVYLGSAERGNDSIAGMLIGFHLMELIAFHKEYTTKHDIDMPLLDKDYLAYIHKWNDRIVSKEPEMKALIEKITKPKEVDIPYIS